MVVRQAVLKALAEQTRSVRIPLNQNSQLIKLARAETVLAQVLAAIRPIKRSAA
jgi:RNA polymerase primary sigma factor